MGVPSRVKLLTLKQVILKKADFKKLVEKYLDGDATEEEITLLFKYYDALQDPGFSWDDSAMGDQETTHKMLYSRILKDIDTRNTPRSINWIRIAAAILILVSVAAFFSKHYLDGDRAVKTAFENDIPPGGNKAVLTLADGSRIALNDAGHGVIAQQAGFKISKTADGQLVYEMSTAASGNSGIGKSGMNTISTPRGGQFQVVLPDGTRVWLNAASTIKYPTPFDGKGRVVELSGEAYFEVAKLDLKNKAGRVPFTVKINTTSGNGGEVQVLGTHFNVMAYEDERKVNTTLLEGSVKFSKGRESRLLKPGQQSRTAIGADPHISVIDDVYMAEVLAWKNDEFEFNNVDIETILRQIARWYDVEVVVEGQLSSENFRGKISRNEPISQVLKVLKLNGINLKMEGRKIIVKP